MKKGTFHLQGQKEFFMKQIIIGKSGVGKSRICVRNAVLNYSGKVILVNSYDATEYLVEYKLIS